MKCHFNSLRDHCDTSNLRIVALTNEYFLRVSLNGFGFSSECLRLHSLSSSQYSSIFLEQKDLWYGDTLTHQRRCWGRSEEEQVCKLKWTNRFVYGRNCETEDGEQKGEKEGKNKQDTFLGGYRWDGEVEKQQSDLWKEKCLLTSKALLNHRKQKDSFGWKQMNIPENLTLEMKRRVYHWKLSVKRQTKKIERG